MSQVAGDSRFGVRGSALTVAVLNLLVLLCFTLPFASVSCGDTRTDKMTGWALASGADAGIRTAPQQAGHVVPETASDVRDVQATLSSLRVFARLEFLLAAAGVLAALLALFWSSLEGQPAHAFLLPGAVVTGLSFVGFLGVGAFAVFGPEVHHYGGFWLAAALSWLGIVPAIVYARYENEYAEPIPDGLRHFQWLMGGVVLVCTLLLFSPGAVLGLVVGVIAAAALFATGMFGPAFMELNRSSFVAAILGGGVLAFLAGGL